MADHANNSAAALRAEIAAITRAREARQAACASLRPPAGALTEDPLVDMHAPDWRSAQDPLHRGDGRCVNPLFGVALGRPTAASSWRDLPVSDDVGVVPAADCPLPVPVYEEARISSNTSAAAASQQIVVNAFELGGSNVASEQVTANEGHRPETDKGLTTYPHIHSKRGRSEADVTSPNHDSNFLHPTKRHRPVPDDRGIRGDAMQTDDHLAGLFSREPPFESSAQQAFQIAGAPQQGQQQGVSAFERLMQVSRDSREVFTTYMQHPQPQQSLPVGEGFGRGVPANRNLLNERIVPLEGRITAAESLLKTYLPILHHICLEFPDVKYPGVADQLAAHAQGRDFQSIPPTKTANDFQQSRTAGQQQLPVSSSAQPVALHPTTAAFIDYVSRPLPASAAATFLGDRRGKAVPPESGALEQTPRRPENKATTAPADSSRSLSAGRQRLVPGGSQTCLPAPAGLPTGWIFFDGKRVPAVWDVGLHGPKPTRMCVYGQCTKYRQAPGHFCINHGGGQRCSEPGCRKSAVHGTGFCVYHGGGKRCAVEGCGNRVSSQAIGLCQAHLRERGVEPPRRGPNIQTITKSMWPEAFVHKSPDAKRGSCAAEERES